MEKTELSIKLKDKLKELNELIDVASEMKLKVIVTQGFHPFSNARTNPLNPNVGISITETFQY